MQSEGSAPCSRRRAEHNSAKGDESDREKLNRSATGSACVILRALQFSVMPQGKKVRVD
jgi:hypothetical protein